ncbi:MAG: hypothetical protein L6290_02240 [Thermodesulfovibrionales bacterium]|nr:hypothetical protein [Thermodesulfovibrionales bacterium]
MLKRPRFIAKIFLIAAFFFIFTVPVPAAMSDYCIIPPYVVTDLKPNVLLFMDNSASMYDLEYPDEGTTTREPAYCYDETYKSTKKYYGYFDQNTNYEYDLINNNFKVTALGLAGCTKVIPNTLCIGLNMATVPPTLTDFRAKGNYLNWLVTSKFDAQKGVLTGGKYCDKVCSNSDITCCTQIADCPAGAGVTCNNVDNFLQAESRGCVGRKFIKEPITADFIDYTPPAADPNISLGITFGVRGPMNDLNSTAASTGGQTYIDLFVGNYLQGECQAAIDAFVEGHDPASIKKAVDDCLSATVSPAAYCQNEPLFPPPLGGCTKDSNCIKAAGKCEGNPKKCTLGNPALIGTGCQKNADCNWDVGPCITGTATTVSKTKVVFNQTIQACWALTRGTPISTDEANTVKNQCTDLYDENFICIGGAKDGKVCAIPADCPGGLCSSGPTVIRPGNPAYLCSTAYAGACYTGSAPAWASSWVSDACIIAAHTAFCGALDIPPVIDPTDDPSVTQEFINLPAIISDIGVEAQLGQPIKSLAVKVRYDSFCAVATAVPCVTDADCSTGDYCKPYGILQEFDGQVRFGMIAFNYNGSAAECNNLTSFKCPRICEKTTSLMCNTTVGMPSIDCPVDNPATGVRELCIATIKDNTNKDAAQIRTYIKSICSISGALCNLDSECPDGEVCRPDVGNHTSGLIREIDKIRATTWTPYAEAFFDAVAYFTQQTASGAVPYRLYTTDFRVPSDVPSEPNPIQGICQDNNIVFISDGMSTTDQNTAVMTFVNANNITGGQITTAPSASWDVAPRFFGSKNLDDLAYYGQNAALSNPVSATKKSRPIMTSVLYSGSECDVKAADGITCTTTDEAVPEKLMQLTAYHGGGIYRLVHNPDQFKAALYDILQSLLKRASAGAAASVLASGEGSGANIVQAVFYPKRKFSLNTAAGTSISSEIRWTGRLGNFWYYVDPLFKGSSIYEDNASAKVLNLTNDNKITFYYDPDLEQTMAERAYDSNNDGVPDTALTPIPFERLNTLWEAGLVLFKRDLGVTPRQIYTTTNGTSLLAGDFSIGNAATLCPFLSPPDYDGDASVACDADDANKLIRYVHGEDFTGLRSRTVPIDLNGNGTLDAGEQRVWKLGDILNSTPRIASWLPQNTYHDVYRDTSYLNIINSAGYKSKNMVYAGGNDGMLHAFRLGSLELGWAGQAEFEKARILPLAGTDFGKEIWAFIPKNVLPYLKYIPEMTYCHISLLSGYRF